jgi:predicted Fe-S protein YdhL (DUF1289 family)
METRKPIASVCKGICKFHEEYKICIGCLRSKLEIRQWIIGTDVDKEQILASIELKRSIYGSINN